MNTFIPRFAPKGNRQMTEEERGPDRIARILQATGFALLVIAIGTVPVMNLFSSYVAVGFTKTVIVLGAALLALVCFCLSTLRSGSIQLNLTLTNLALWVVAGVALVSALITSDRNDALWGEAIEVHTTAFLGILALVATLGAFFAQSRVMALRFYQVLFLATTFLGLFHLLRIVFGPEVLSFGVFTTALTSPLGAWNDLAIFFGLTAVLCLITLEQMPLSRIGQTFTLGLTTLSLIILSVVNFSYVWIVIGLVSLIFLMYSLTRGRFSPEAEQQAHQAQSILPLIAHGLVFVVSAMFIMSGSFIGNWVSEHTGIQYIEVRPSLEATIDIARGVYSENAFTGVGPNRFADAWRLYKDPSINNTIFWNTNFVSGSGYIPTWFVTTGIFGILAWLVFLGTLLYTGYRTLIQSPDLDRFWYFVGSSSFVSALFIWGMSFVYVPGAALLLFAAFSTGLTVAAYSKLAKKNSGRNFTIADRRTGFALIAGVMVILIGSVGILYLTTRQYAAVYTFSKALNEPGATRDTAVAGINDAFTLRQSDTFARQLGRLETERLAALAQLSEPSEQQVAQYQQSVVLATNALRLARDLDPTQPLNWGFLGQLYFLIAGVSSDELRAQANQFGVDAIATAKALDPQNPEYRLLEAQLAAQRGNTAAAREYAAEAIRLKRDFTAAFNLIAQLDIAEGNSEAAVASVRSIIQLEPNNPARYYQLGILLSSTGDIAGTISALETAIAIDPEYANARYVLALAYLEEGREAEAISQLEVVRDLNPDNAGVQTLVDQIRSGEISATPSITPAEDVTDPSQVNSDGEVTTTTVAPDTDLVTPLNPVPGSDAESDSDSVPPPETAPAANEDAGSSE